MKHRQLVRSYGLTPLSLLALRHTHASQLIASGTDIVTVSRRVVRGAPPITLDVYAHLIKPTGLPVVAVIDAAFGNS